MGRLILKYSLAAVAVLLGAFVAVSLIAPARVAESAISLERMSSGLVEQSVSIKGDPWPYLEGGPEDADVVVLLHGFGGDKDNWTRFAKSLTDEYHVIIPDLPGFGESNRYWDQDYSIPEQARRLEEFITFMDFDSVHLVGHSMGGHLAGYYAGQHPLRIRSLGLVTNAGIESPEPAELARVLAEGGENVLIPRTRDEFDELIAFASYEPPFIPWPVSTYVADQAIAQAAFKEYVFGSLWGDDSAALEPILPRIAAPVFVLWGRHDRLLHVSTVDVIQKLKPGATIVIIEEAGHLPILEAPAESAAYYRDFLAAAR